MFHIGEDGEPRSCKAQQGNCPLSPADDHHATKEAARTAYEKQNADALFASMSEESFEIKDLKMTPAEKEDLIINDKGEVVGFALPKGKYILMDPEELLEDSDDTAGNSPGWERWAEAAGASDNRIGCDGEVYSARINGYAVSAIPAYTGSGEFKVGEDDWVSTRSGLIAAVPFQLAELLGFDEADGPEVNISDHSDAFYSENSYNIYFGEDCDVYTGYPEDEDDDD